MTYREKVAIEHPEAISDAALGGVKDCPLDYGYEGDYDCDGDCAECWNREIPGTEPIEQTETITPTNTVNHPTHYNHEGAIECIEEMITLFGKVAVKHFCLCNAWKYRYRAGTKDGVEDTNDRDKANWYINKYKELCK